MSIIYFLGDHAKYDPLVRYREGVILGRRHVGAVDPDGRIFTNGFEGTRVFASRDQVSDYYDTLPDDEKKRVRHYRVDCTLADTFEHDGILYLTKDSLLLWP